MHVCAFAGRYVWITIHLKYLFAFYVLSIFELKNSFERLPIDIAYLTERSLRLTTDTFWRIAEATVYKYKQRKIFREIASRQ